MTHRKHFALHKPEPAVKITRNDKNPPSFNVAINDLSLAIFNTKPYQNIAGLNFTTSNTSMSINITISANFARCDQKFRSLIGNLNTEHCGLSLADVDKITREFNHFLVDNKIHSTFTNELRHSNERENPNIGFAY